MSHIPEEAIYNENNDNPEFVEFLGTKLGRRPIEDGGE